MAEKKVPTLDPKDPGEVLDYTWDFTNLLESAEKITAINSATITPISATSPLTVDSSAIDVSGKKVTVWFSDGENCAQYTVAVNVTTDAFTPRTFERSLIVPVEDR